MAPSSATALELRAKPAAIDGVPNLRHEPFAGEVTTDIEHAHGALRAQAVIADGYAGRFHPQALRAELILPPLREVGRGREARHDVTPDRAELLLQGGARRRRCARQEI